jgi:hypothetical protein
MVRALLPGWLRAPVEVRVSFDGRPYTLGERIHVGVELSPRRDVDVAEVRVDLVCEETWAETWVRHDSMGRAGGVVTRGPELQGPPVPKRVVKKFKASFVHSTAPFMKDVTLRPDSAVRRSVALEVDTEIPPHAQGGTLAWTLVTTLETARGRRVKDTQPVMVAIS